VFADDSLETPPFNGITQAPNGGFGITSGSPLAGFTSSVSISRLAASLPPGELHEMLDKEAQIRVRTSSRSLRWKVLDDVAAVIASGVRVLTGPQMPALGLEERHARSLRVVELGG